jgi:hypothetical protein
VPVRALPETRLAYLLRDLRRARYYAEQYAAVMARHRRAVAGTGDRTQAAHAHGEADAAARTARSLDATMASLRRLDRL